VLEPGEPRPRCARSDHRRASHSGRTAPRQSSRATITMRVRVSVTAAASATMSCCSWRQRAIETDWVSRSVTESHGPPIYLKLTFFRLLCVDRLQRTAFPLEGPSGPDRHPPPKSPDGRGRTFPTVPACNCKPELNRVKRVPKIQARHVAKSANTESSNLPCANDLISFSSAGATRKR
jgi:hypothetical protein